MNLQENIKRIKEVMGLNEGVLNSIRDRIIERVPFLKEYDIYEDRRHPKDLRSHKITYHKNVKVKMGDEIVTFKQYNVTSKVIYYSQKIHDNTFHYFHIENNFAVMPPDDMDDLTVKILFNMLNKVSDDLSYGYEIVVKDGDEFPMDEFDNVINEMNGVLFRFEEYTEKNNIDLF